MAAAEPVVEQAQLAGEQIFVVGREVGGRRDRLQLQQLGDGIVEQGVGVVAVDDVQVGVRAEVFQQQETGIDVLRQHPRHAYAAGFEQAAHLQPRPHVFLVRRRIHHDA